MLPSLIEVPDWWSGAALARPEHQAVVVEPPVAPPFSVAWIASVAGILRATPAAGPLIVVGHGLAGPLLPAVARTQRAGGRRIGGYVFVDATLPRPGRSSHLDLLRAAAAETADAAHHALHGPDSRWPLDADRPQSHDFWTESLPPAVDWPDAPCAYVRVDETVPGVGPTAFWARSARSRGWPTHDGADLASLLTEAIDGLPG